MQNHLCVCVRVCGGGVCVGVCGVCVGCVCVCVCVFSVEWFTNHKQNNYNTLLNWSHVEVYVWSHNYKIISLNEPTFLTGGRENM